MQNKLIIWVAGGAVFMLATLVGGYFLIKAQNTLLPTIVTKQPISLSTSTNSTNSTNWKTFTSEAGHYQIKYPSEMTGLGYPAVMGASSSVSLGNMAITLLTQFDTTHNSGALGADNPVLVSSPAEFEKTVDATKTITERLKKQIDSSIVFTSEHTTVNGYDAITLTSSKYRIISTENFFAIDHFIFILHNRHVYRIYFYDNFEDTRLTTSDFGPLLNTFRFTDE